MAPPPVIATPTLPDGKLNAYYSADIQVTGGIGDPTLSVSAGALPTGLSLQQVGITGGPRLVGTPTAAGEYIFSLIATDTQPVDSAAVEYVVTIFGDTVEIAAAMGPDTYGTRGSGVYEVFQQCLGKDPVEAIHFAEYMSEMGDDGHYTQAMYGADTGLRRFRLQFPMIAGFTASATIISNGVTYTPEAYIWNLFRRTKRTGRPFVIRSARNDQNYLVTFPASYREMEETRFLTKLFASQLELIQVRVDGVTVFNPTRMPIPPWGWYGRAEFDYAGGLAVDNSGNARNLTINGNVASGGDEQNGFPSARFNGGGTNTGYLNTAEDPTIYEAFFVMQMNEATFSNNAGILTGSAGNTALTGVSGTTRFADPITRHVRSFTFRKNGLPYEAGDLQAPMEGFGLVHARWQRGVALTNLQIGKNLGTAGTYAEMDLGEVILFNSLNAEEDSLELAEHLMDVWDV